LLLKKLHEFKYMYNKIPSERTLKRTIVIILLCCVALVSALAAGYFSWLLEQQQRMDRAVFEEADRAAEELMLVVNEEKEEKKVEDPVFTYPVIVQPERRTELPDEWGGTLLMAMLEDWKDANRDSGYCTSPYQFSEQESLRDWDTRWETPGYVYFADAGIRAALISYFGVSSENEQEFFDGIDIAMDNDDTFAEDGVMCSSDSGTRKFLLLNDTREVVQESGKRGLRVFPEVLEWSENSTFGPSWIMYPAGEYPVMDGYRFYSDWYGNVIVRTGYGDAGYANWETQLLEVSAGVPTMTLIEKCNVEPTEDYEDSLTTCEIRYTE
jgi:hypothetical protein